jgi:ArsR family transcriptional regulator
MQDKLESEKCARYLKALADPERLKIIQCLQTGPKNVGHIADLLKADLANVSHHLGVLRNAGIVHDQKQGKYVVYSLDPEVLQNKDVLDLGCCRLDLGKK